MRPRRPSAPPHGPPSQPAGLQPPRVRLPPAAPSPRRPHAHSATRLCARASLRSAGPPAAPGARAPCRAQRPPSAQPAGDTSGRGPGLRQQWQVASRGGWWRHCGLRARAAARLPMLASAAHLLSGASPGPLRTNRQPRAATAHGCASASALQLLPAAAAVAAAHLHRPATALTPAPCRGGRLPPRRPRPASGAPRPRGAPRGRRGPGRATAPGWPARRHP
mmetsp:Transcript_90436/g.279709  ORF Transcript_90436/g.279709 Transcript_90436/m.279709 type:complete len:221 (-) Transcript_90436:2-664(-)